MEIRSVCTRVQCNSCGDYIQVGEEALITHVYICMKCAEEVHTVFEHHCFEQNLT